MSNRFDIQSTPLSGLQIVTRKSVGDRWIGLLSIYERI
jgi:hypothetical protein